MTDFPLIARDPGDILLHGPSGPVTVGRFLERAETLAAEFRRDLPSGAPIVNLCRDRGGFALTFAAAAMDGRISLLGGDRSAQRLVLLAERYPGAVAVTDEDAAIDGLPTVRLPPPLLPTVRRLGEPLPDPVRPVPVLPGERIVAEVFTSGSTGDPVAHAKRWRALGLRSAAAALQFGIGVPGPTSIVGTVPSQHMYGFETTILLPFHAHAAAWTGPAFFPDDIRTALAAMPAPRLLVTTPLQLRALIEADTELSPLQAIISASAPLGRELAAAAERRWGAPVLEIFGATEVGSIASRRTVEDAPWRLYPGVSLVPTEDGDGVRVEAEGGGPEMLHDVVELVGEDGFRLVDRRADLVKIGGRRASLSGLNRVLTAIDGVADGVFVAPEDREDGPPARMRVFVVAEAARRGAIMSALRRRIDPAFLPRELVFVERLPRNEMGKLPRQALAALAAGRG